MIVKHGYVAYMTALTVLMSWLSSKATSCWFPTSNQWGHHQELESPSSLQASQQAGKWLLLGEGRHVDVCEGVREAQGDVHKDMWSCIRV